MAFLDEKGLAAVWKKITAKLNGKSSKKHIHEYTPEGDISVPTISVSSDKVTIQEISDVGTLPEYSPASYTAPSYIEPTLNHSYDEEEQIVTLQYSNGFFSAGSFTDGTFTQGTLPTISTKEALSSVTAEAGVLTFTGKTKSTEETNESNE